MKNIAISSIGLLLLLLLAIDPFPAASEPMPSAAPSKPAPIAFLQDRDARAQKLLAQSPDDSLSAELRARIKEHINEVFDFAELSRLALGDHWEERTAEEKTHFVETFSAIIQEQNFDNFLRYYREGRIDYQSEEIEGDRATVKAQVPLKREQIQIEYLLHTVDGQWRIYDLVIDGVSTAEGNRRRYARYIEKNSYAKLIEQLDKQLARLRENNG